MVSVEAARTVVGILGNIICFFLFLSPVPTFVKIWKKGSVEKYSAFPYMATLLSCLAWTLYALPMVHPGNTLVLTISALGIAVESIFIILFFIFSDKKQRLKLLLLLLLELIFIALMAFLALTLVHTHNKRSMIVGLVCVCLTVVMYSSPLVVMVPNGLGSLFGLAQLNLHAVYYKSTKQQLAARKGKELISGFVRCCRCAWRRNQEDGSCRP